MTGTLDDFSLLADLTGPSDLQSRPAYLPSLDATDATLAEVLAPYHFDEPYPCGLASCRQPHQQGFLVVTDDGFETNVGKDCGKRIFGEEFAIKANLNHPGVIQTSELAGICFGSSWSKTCQNSAMNRKMVTLGIGRIAEPDSGR